MKAVNPGWPKSTVKVLVVGGQNDQVQTYQNTFKEIVPGWEVIIIGCTRPEEAMESLRTDSFTFNIILFEDELPGMSGQITRTGNKKPGRYVAMKHSVHPKF